jgi:hypothetical protein
MRSVPALLLALFVVALAPAGAAAASFPTNSYLHTMRHAVRNGSFLAISEDNCTREIEKLERKAKRLEDRGYPELAQAVRDSQASPRGTLHYLKALDDRISAEDPQRFRYRPLLRWMDHIRHRLFADVRDAAKGQHKSDGIKSHYANGGLTALNTNRIKIVAIAHERGVAVR